MMTRLVAFGAGVLFAVGLVVSHMTWPSKIIGFLNVTGDWDPSLMFVMCGAIPVYFIADRIRRRRQSPLLAEEFKLPTRTDIDARLLIGAVIFGVGWGLAGFCPGPAIASLSGGLTEMFVFIGCMMAGLYIVDTVSER